jgi:hypothetical protein
VSLPGASGSRLVVDRLAGTHSDARLVAHLAADEPLENASLVCAMYLEDPTRGRCRPVTEADLDVVPLADAHADQGAAPSADLSLRGLDGATYGIRRVDGDGRLPELRWTRSAHADIDHPLQVRTLRDVLAHFEAYGPMRQMTVGALASLHPDARVSTVTLRGELSRANASRLVLNRGLREAVTARVARGGLSMSEIAIRCGRFRRDRRDNLTGETSWLARRIGQTRDSDRSAPTPWVHTEVLALIARRGLGLSPHEVEL